MKNIKFLSGVAIALSLSTLTACGSKTHTSERNFFVTGVTGDQQYGAAVEVEMTAFKLIDIGDWANKINEHNGQIESIVTKSAAFIPATGEDDGLLEENIKAEIEKQLPEIEAATYGIVRAENVRVLSAYNYVIGAQASFDKFMAQNEGKYYGGGASGQDSDGDGYISAQTNYTEPIPNRPDILALQCAVNGNGCKVNGENLSPIQMPGVGALPSKAGAIADD